MSFFLHNLKKKASLLMFTVVRNQHSTTIVSKYVQMNPSLPHFTFTQSGSSTVPLKITLL